MDVRRKVSVIRMTCMSIGQMLDSSPFKSLPCPDLWAVLLRLR